MTPSVVSWSSTMPAAGLLPPVITTASEVGLVRVPNAAVMPVSAAFTQASVMRTGHAPVPLPPAIEVAMADADAGDDAVAEAEESVAVLPDEHPASTSPPNAAKANDDILSARL